MFALPLTEQQQHNLQNVYQAQLNNDRLGIFWLARLDYLDTTTIIIMGFLKTTVLVGSGIYLGKEYMK